MIGKRLILILFLLTTVKTVSAQTESMFKVPERGFISQEPAKTLAHALISGNGTMGALVMGEPYDETIIFSQSDLYLPLNDPKAPINQASRQDEIRDPFIPAFDLHLSQEQTAIKRYQRSVNFETGEAIVNWTDDNGSFERSVFVSRADSLIVVSIKGNAKINTTLYFAPRPVLAGQRDFVNSGIAEMKTLAEDGLLSFQGKFKNHYKDGLQGYEGLGRVILKGGKSEVVGNKLQISDADEVLLLIQIQPSKNWSNSLIPEMSARLSAIISSYTELKVRHATIHSRIFNRSRLSLNSSPADQQLSTEALLLNAKSEVPAALIEKVYDAGRYNIISAMGSNPADFTDDGNLPATIASVLSSNMPELMDAYFRYLEKNMPTFRENARLLYGVKGIHIPAHTSNNGLDTDFGEIRSLTYWTGAAGWAADFFYDYYQYTQDRTFLKSRAYPFMKEAVQFYEAFLTIGADGKSQTVINATMDVMIARQLLTNCIAAAKTLALDAPKVKIWTDMLSKMPTYEVASDGTLREWLWPGAEENISHRHVPQLYSLYNKVDSAIIGDPKLLAAANKTIDDKMKFRTAEGGGEMSFGLVQLGLSAAHIGAGEKAKAVVDYLASKYWSTALGSFHNVGDLFNTDISGGLPAVILEMLVYSEQDMIKLLPALPSAWNKGKLEGALLRGNIDLKSLEWDNKQVKLTLNTKVKRALTLVFPADVEKLIINGFSVSVNRIRNREFLLNLAQAKDIKLEITLK